MYENVSNYQIWKHLICRRVIQDLSHISHTDLVTWRSSALQINQKKVLGQTQMKRRGIRSEHHSLQLQVPCILSLLHHCSSVP